MLNAREFYTLADWLATTQANEVGFRTAINRVYYAAHLMAREWLRKGNWEPRGRGDDHSGVIRELKSRGRLRQLGWMLDELRELREHVDYHLESTESSLNRVCSHCTNARRSASDEPLVNEHHWNNVQEISRQLLPRLESL